MGDETRMKGINFLGTLASLRRGHGDVVHDEVLAQVPGEAGANLREGMVIAGSWYPVSHYRALLETIVQVTGREDVVQELARDAVRHDFETLFRVVRIVLTPQRILPSAVRVFRRYFSDGEITIVNVEDGWFTFRVDGVHGLDRRSWLDLAGGAEGVLVSMGREDVRSEIVAGGGQTDGFAEISLRWR